MGCLESRTAGPKAVAEPPGKPSLSDEELAWRIFARLDLQDEAERLELAQFLQQLMKYTPEGERRATDEAGVFGPDPALEIPGEGAQGRLPGEEGEASGPGDDDGVALLAPETPRRSLMARISRKLSFGSIGFTRSTREVPRSPATSDDETTTPEAEEPKAPVEAAQDPQAFEIRQTTVDEMTVQELRGLFTSGGKLATESFQRLLREAYLRLRDSPNVQHLELGAPPETITVVGDLHGSLRDLLHILESAGLPGPEHKIIFNGDFVDRGSEGCEVLALILALQLAFPKRVSLNRGNHEDEALSRVYGFETEVAAKYDAKTFEMCALLFRHIPLCTTINRTVLVLHGGLFHRDDVTLADLDRIPRTEYGPLPPEAEGQSNPGWYRSLPSEKQDYFMLNAVCCELLWSDPMAERGQKKSPRGSGMLIGPDMCSEWLVKNGFDLLVRSHEAVQKGFALPYADAEGCSDTERGSCATVFSASDCCGIGNQGACLSFSLKQAGEELQDSEGAARGFEVHPVGVTDLTAAGMYYVVYDHYTSADKPDLGAYNDHNLATRILRKKPALGRAFAPLEDPADHSVSVADFSSVMTRVLALELPWDQVLPLIAPASSVGIRPTGARSRGPAETRVRVDAFLQGFASSATQRVEKGGEGDEDDALLEALYENYGRLEAVFRFFDVDGSGKISRQEFRRGCELVNERIPAESEKLASCEKILGLIDLDSDGELNMNEFFEVFRLAKPAVE